MVASYRWADFLRYPSFSVAQVLGCGIGIVQYDPAEDALFFWLYLNVDRYAFIYLYRYFRLA